MNESEKDNDTALDVMFAAAKAADPVPSGDLMARIMADAASVNIPPHAAAATLSAPKGMLDILSDVFGGWAGASTLAACIGLGLMVGFSSPQTILSYVPGGAVDAGEDVFGLYFDTDL